MIVSKKIVIIVIYNNIMSNHIIIGSRSRSQQQEVCLVCEWSAFDWMAVCEQGVIYSMEASSSINTGVETTRSHLAD